MSKFSYCELVVGKDGSHYYRNPCVILGDHTFPDGTAAYRMRDCLPGHCLVDGAELWSKSDFYLSASYVDENFVSLWKHDGIFVSGF